VAGLEAVLTTAPVPSGEDGLTDPAVKARIVALWKKGRRYTDIMAELRVSYATVFSTLKAAGLNQKLPPRRGKGPAWFAVQSDCYVDSG
jgi:hypothetical protein